MLYKRYFNQLGAEQLPGLLGIALAHPMSAIHMAAAQIEAGIGEAYLCVGVESMMAIYPQAYMPMGETAEINEALASQALACMRDLGLDPDKVNLDGGALALGHPLGAIGARITGRAAAWLARTGGRYAMATQCIGGGQGIATVLEPLQ